jgi:hypothetical protein
MAKEEKSRGLYYGGSAQCAALALPGQSCDLVAYGREADMRIGISFWRFLTRAMLK